MEILKDTRNKAFDATTAASGFDANRFANEATRLTRNLGHTITPVTQKVNRFTGHVTELKAENAPAFASAPAVTPDQQYVDAALAFARSVSGALGFAASSAPAEFDADPNVQKVSEDMRAVSLKQTHRSIGVWGMEPKVWFKDGAVEKLVGDSVSLPQDLPVVPTVAAETAVRVGALEAAKPRTRKDPFTGNEEQGPSVDVSQYKPQRLSSFADPAQKTVFAKGPFADDVPVELVYFYTGGAARLAWKMTFTLPDFSSKYVVIVEADRVDNPDAPEILYMSDQAHRASVRGRVFTHNPGEGAVTDVSFPRPASEYPVPLPSDFPPGFPPSWTVAEGAQFFTRGNNTQALNGQTGRPVQTDVDAGGGGVFTAANATSADQFVINIFYFCNYMHDFFYMLGFTEAAGNFQVVNPTGQGRGADPVMARAHPGPVFGTANMLTRADGIEGMMNMGLVAGVNRHTALDSDVVFHEFTHGVTNRLVGGMLDAEGLDEEQSGAMGEGWSDYFALTIQNFNRPAEKTVTGDWVTKRTGGIRQAPYDANYPGKFGDIGKGVGEVAGHPSLTYQEVHDVGEIWCAALMQMNRNVGAALGDPKRGHQIAWQAVVSGLKLTPKNPSFLVGRNAILRALRALRDTGRITGAEAEPVRRAAWEAFAAFGMGANAFCPNASFQGCQGDGTVPADPNVWEV